MWCGIHLAPVQASMRCLSLTRSAAMLRRTWAFISGFAQPKKRPGEPVARIATSVPWAAGASSYRTVIGNGLSTCISTRRSGSWAVTTYP